MRRSRLAPIATVLTLSTPAQAGVIATYRMGDHVQMVVEVNDRGQARITTGDTAMLILDGTPYMIAHDAEGSYAARFEDAFAASMAAFDGDDSADPASPAPRPAEAPPPGPPRPQIVMTRVGPETVAGRAGTLWRLHDPAAAPGREQDEEIVLSADPDLAPLGPILNLPPPAENAPDPGGARTVRATIRREGVPLRQGRYMRLERVDVRPLPDAFALPGPPLDRAAYEARQQRALRARQRN